MAAVQQFKVDLTNPQAPQVITQELERVLAEGVDMPLLSAVFPYGDTQIPTLFVWYLVPSQGPSPDGGSGEIGLVPEELDGEAAIGKAALPFGLDGVAGDESGGGE
jgi:hypothetical protein